MEGLEASHVSPLLPRYDGPPPRALFAPPPLFEEPPVPDPDAIPPRVFDAPLLPPVKTGLLQNPPNLLEMRRLLFAVNEPLIFSPQHWAQWWPYMNNVWVKNRTSKPHGGIQISYYYCKLWRKAGAPQGKGLRNRKIRDLPPCPIKLKIIKDLSSGYYSIDRLSARDVDHNHDLDALDAIKRNKVLMELAVAEVAKGYSFADIAQALHAPNVERALIEAGGRYLNRQDVKNAAKEWRQNNPDAPVGAQAPLSYPVMTMTGGCRCAAVTYTSTDLPLEMSNCHCVTCRKISGAPFITFVTLHTSSVTWTSGEASVKVTSYSDMAERAHCVECGTPLYMKYKFQMHRISIPAGTIDEASVKGVLLKPTEHIFLAEKAGWYELLEDGLERHAEFPPEFQAKIDGWRKELMEADSP